MATGWARDGAVQEQIDASIEDAVKHARNRLPQGESHDHCEECGTPIPAARQQAIPGVRFCVACQSARWTGNRACSAVTTGAGSKDSQLR